MHERKLKRTHTYTHTHTHTHTHTAREMGCAQPVEAKPLHSRLSAFEEAFESQTEVCICAHLCVCGVYVSVWGG